MNYAGRITTKKNKVHCNSVYHFGYPMFVQKLKKQKKEVLDS